MKILTGIDIPFLPSSGSPIICNDWYSNLPDDIEVRFLALPPHSGNYEKWWSIKEVVLLDLEKKTSTNDFNQYVNHLKDEIEKQLELFEPDIIHCQHLNFGLSMAIAKIENLLTPKIGICHGTDVQLATRSSFFLETMKFIRSKMDLLFFPTQTMANDYFKYDKCEKEYVVFSHGIPDKAYSSSFKLYRRNQDEPFKILYAGRLNSFKGADILVSAMRYLPEDVHLTVIGNEDEIGYKEKILAAIEQYRLHRKVSLLEALPRQQLWKRFSDFDLIAFPSTELECFSLTTIEAQAQGLVVAYHENAGGIENVVRESGLKISENTPQIWARKIKEIYCDRSILEEYRKIGYENSQRYRLSTKKNSFFQFSRDFLLLSPHKLQLKTSFLEAGQRFYNIYQEEKQKWQAGNVIATEMKDGLIIPKTYCLSTIARVQEQIKSPIEKIEKVRTELCKAGSGQFLYPLESLHISLQGCTERLSCKQSFSIERIEKIEQACTEIFQEEEAIDIFLCGLNILGPQVFIQAFPCNEKWAVLRQKIETCLLNIGENPIIYPDKKPMHMNIMRIIDNSPDKLDQVLKVVDKFRCIEIGKLQVSIIQFLITDFLVASSQVKVLKKFYLM